MSDDVSSAAYWNGLYLKGDTGWDKGDCNPVIARMLGERLIPDRARLAVVGSGRGHEALEAARCGYRVSAIDFAEEASKAVAAAATAAKLNLEPLTEDVFTLPGRRPRHYDAVLEHTCFCAVAVARRAEYVEAIHTLLKPGGVLFGVFYAHGKEGGPPFDTTEAEVRTLFAPRFSIVRLKIAADSWDHRAGNELEAVLIAS